VSDYYDRQGNPMTWDEWVKGYKDDFESTRRVAKTTIGDMFISTVWLGLDHGLPDTPPLIFETLIMGGVMDQNMWRYSTEEEAVAGHEQAVNLAKATVAAQFGKT
jgi:hypothetical protein